LEHKPTAIVSCAGKEVDNLAKTERWSERDKKNLDFICVGLLEPRKGHEDLIEAIYALRRDRGIKCCGKIVGIGPNLEMLTALIERYDLKNQVSIADWNRSWFSDALSASFLVHPSREFEGIPLVVLEAMGLGMPILATNVGGVPEAISSEHNGLLVKARNPDALASEMARLMSESSTRARLGRNAHEKYLSEFTVPKYVDQWTEYLAVKNRNDQVLSERSSL
jgi:glycosyltransferase involved in cell wall biosynthesis